MSLPYGFMSVSGNRIIVDPEKANIVKTIFQQYPSGMSLGGIADFLFDHGILSPKGKEHWTQPVLSNLLSNQKYIGYIISFDDFFLVQGEKSKRSNIDEDTNQRKVTRYNSQSVLSDLFLCADCNNYNYRFCLHKFRDTYASLSAIGDLVTHIHSDSMPLPKSSL